MIQKLTLIMCLLFLAAETATAQSKTITDSLMLVNDYLLAVKTTVNTKQWDGKKQFQKVTTLLKTGDGYHKKLPSWFNAGYTTLQTEQITQQFTHILQTLALYKADIKTLHYKRPTNQAAMVFLNAQIPKLVDAINSYCKIAEEERLKKIN